MEEPGDDGRSFHRMVMMGGHFQRMGGRRMEEPGDEGRSQRHLSFLLFREISSLGMVG